jgi:hypothetical protein
MRGHSQATLVATATGVLSLVVPFLGLLSAAVVGLVTLRNGVRDGLLAMALAALATGLISWLALGSPWAAAGILIVLWLPVWGLGAILRGTRALGLTVQLAALGGLAVVLVIRLVVGDPAAYWQQLLEPLRETLVGEGLVAADASQVLLGQWARWMTGAFAAALVLQYLLSLFIARWWQARLYNPGGFGEEFRGLAVSRAVGLLFLALVGWSVLAGGRGLALDLIPVPVVLLALQGLAVAHRLRELFGAQRAWLLTLYLLLILFMPQVGLLLASVGLIDLWVDLRARAARGRPTPR